MVRFAVLAMLLLGVAGSGVMRADVQHKTAKVERWEQVETLKPGQEINVLAGTRSAPDLCLVASVDDNALTCLAEDVPSETRLVYPRSAVRDVWVIEEAPNRHVGLWIGIALSVALEAAACVSGGEAGGLAMGAILAVAWAAVEDPRPGPIWFPRPPGPPRSMKTPQWRRRLVYRAALGAVAP